MFKNKKVAFVASGGAARGIAHVGVLKACEELGIKFDFMIGASAGAIVSVLYSQYRNVEKIEDLFRPAYNRKWRKTLGWTDLISTKNFFGSNIMTGLMDMSRAEEHFKSILQTDSFNDLSIPVHISATNVFKNSGEIFNAESNVSISKALCASSCIPLIFRPVKINDQYYIDGEIKRPVSVKLACDLGADVIIVSDIYKPVFNYQIPNAFNIISQITNMVLEDKSMRGITMAKDKYPDKKIFLISPSVGNVPMINTFAWRRLVNAGYNSTIEAFNEYSD